MPLTPLSDVKRVAWNKGLKGKQSWHNISGLGENIDFKKRGESISKSMTGIKRSESYKKEKSILMKRKWLETEYRDNMKKSQSEKKLSEDHKNKLRLRFLGENSHFWKGGITAIGIKIRNSFEYKTWRSKIFQRDNWTCKICNIKGGDLQVDHYPNTFKEIMNKYNIQSIEDAILCEELWSIDSNRTLCIPCHRLVHFDAPKGHHKNKENICR